MLESYEETDPGGYVSTLTRKITWETFFTNSDVTTCPIKECVFLENGASTEIARPEYEPIQVLEGKMTPYARTDLPAGYTLQRSIRCKTRDAWLLDGPTQDKDWLLTLTIKQQRNCVRYLPPLDNILTTAASHASLQLET